MISFTSAFRFQIFQKILLAMLAVALVPLSVVWYIDYRSANERITRGIQQQLADTSDKLVTQVDDWVTMNLKALNQNAALADVQSLDPARQAPILRAILAEYQWSYLVHTVGPSGMNIARSDDKEPIDYADRVYVKQVLAGQPMGQQVVISRTNNKPALILSAPIYTTDPGVKTAAAVIAIAMSITDISERVTNLRIGNTGYAFLLDEGGKVVAHQKEEFANTSADFSKHPAFVDRPSGGKGHITYQDGAKTVIAYVQTTQQGWTLVTQEDYDEAYAPLRAANTQALSVLAVTLVVVTLIAFVFARGLSRPIRNLTRVADELSHGRMVMKIAEVQRRDEIGALAAAIDRMGASIQLAIERLKTRA